MTKSELMTLLGQVGVTSAVATYNFSTGFTGGVTGLSITPSSGYKTSQVDWRTEIANFVFALVTETEDADALPVDNGKFGTVTIDVTNNVVTDFQEQRDVLTDAQTFVT